MSLFAPSAPGRSPSSREQAVVLTAFLVVASLLYRPWTSAPFDLLDFSEFIPRLRASASAWESFTGLVEYYLGHGRLNPVVFALIVAKWEVFGDWTPGWQWARVALLLLIIRQSYALYRQLGASGGAAVAGAAVFLVAPAASPAWSRLSIGEPLGTTFILWAAALAMRARAREDRTASWLLAVAILLLALTKEMMMVCLVLPAALYLFPVGQSVQRSFLGHVRALAPAIVSVAASTLLILWAYTQTIDTGYATDYGRSKIAIVDVIPPWLFSFFPFDPFTGEAAALYTLLTIGFLSVLFVGARLFTRANADHRRALRVSVGLSLVLPALIALEYVPWPVFNRFYYFPALATLGGLVALSLSGFEPLKGAARVTAFAVVVACYLAGVVQTRANADRAFAVRFAVANMVRFVGARSVADTLFVGARVVATGWQGLPATLHRYGPVVNVELPVLESAACAEGEAAARDTTRNVGYIGFASGCRAPERFTRSFNQQFLRFSTGKFRLVPDSVRIDVVLPRERGES